MLTVVASAYPRMYALRSSRVEYKVVADFSRIEKVSTAFSAGLAPIWGSASFVRLWHRSRQKRGKKIDGCHALPAARFRVQ